VKRSFRLSLPPQRSFRSSLAPRVLEDSSRAPASQRSLKTLAAWSLATWFGCGLSPIAPGTVGTLGTLPLYFLVRGGGPIAILVTAAIVTAVGIWASNIVVTDSGEEDPQRIVIDEAAGVLVALAAAPPTWTGIALAVGLFRLFDITKPFPARRAERLPAGWGVVADDLAAGVWAAALVLMLTRILPITG
jgi:phosphatidylglycerophosphatase A